jgi:hypothetical protein
MPTPDEITFENPSQKEISFDITIQLLYRTTRA